MRHRIHFLLTCVLLLGGCAETQLAAHVAKNALPQNTSQGNFKVGKPYKVDGQWYTPQETYNLTETGIASWYGTEFQGKRTANGEVFDMNELTAAHRTLQMPSLVRVTNLENGRSLIVRVNDRGPFKRGRVMDVSKRAAELLGFKSKGTAKVKLQLLSKESQDLAMAAKRGDDTRGSEISMNEGRKPVMTNAVLTSPEPTGYEVQTASAQQAPVTGHYSSEGNFMPDPVIKQVPVSPTSIFIQAGAFGNPDNAGRMALSMQGYGRAQVYPAMVHGQQFYRVRIGPLASVDDADAMLARIANDGHPEAIIIVE